MNKLQLRLTSFIKQCYLTDKWLDITKHTNVLYLKKNVSEKHNIKYNKNMYRGRV